MIQVLADNIRSASNIGSVFRTCDAFAVSTIYLCGISATPPNKEILKTALGATETVAWEYHTDAKQLVKQLKASGKCILAIEQDQNSIPVSAFEYPAGKEVVLILGNEVDGVTKEILDLADHILEIPQYGSKKSLNVSVAAGIAIWELHCKSMLSKP